MSAAKYAKHYRARTPPGTVPRLVTMLPLSSRPTAAGCAEIVTEAGPLEVQKLDDSW